MKLPNYPRKVSSVQEILDLADEYRIPLKYCRFFINQDMRKPRAFGIYYDGLDWVVYKNKANGERAIRYKGKNEAYAAQQIWSKFLSEADARRTESSFNNKTSKSRTKTKKSGKPPLGNLFVWLDILAIVIAAVYLLISRPNNRYVDETGTYRFDDGVWYVQDDDGGWSMYYGDTSDFTISSRSSDWSLFDSDSDSSWDSDWDFWDSSDTDWDSDW